MGGWFKAIGSFASLDGSISTPGFDTQAGGFLAGFDKAFSPNLTGGIALGYLHTNLSEAGGASGSLDTPRLAVYGTYTLGDFAIDATAGYAYDFINSSRPFATLGQTASSSYNGQEANAALQVSTRANFAGITFMPAAGLAYVHVAQNGVSESGAPGFNLSVNGNSANSLRPFVGLTAAKSYTTDGGMVITPEADIAYSYETLNTTPPSLIQVGGGSFTVPGPDAVPQPAHPRRRHHRPAHRHPRLRGRLSHHPADGEHSQPDDLARPRLQVLSKAFDNTRFTYRVKSMIASKRHPVDSL